MKFFTINSSWRWLFLSTLFTFTFSPMVTAAPSLAVEPTSDELFTGEPFIYHLKPEKRGGKAYKLVYLVDVPIDVSWKFKTDFHSDVILTNKFIKEHRFIRRKKNVVITESNYSNSPNVTFRWRTTLYPSNYRMEFVLENYEECGQRFHYGHIQLRSVGRRTKITHVAYFDFFGATLWVNYPWHGGMLEFLDYIARWEKETVSRLKDKYGGKVIE